MKASPRICGAIALCLGASALVAPRALLLAQETSHRDAYQRVPDVASALGARPGAHVADVGAGGGYFTHHLRRAVGEIGRVYAVDIAQTQVARLRHDLDLAGARNVDVILGEPDDPKLPYGSLDGALIVNAYHEMTEYPEMLAALRASLRPGGRLVILDNPPPDSIADRDGQTERHEIRIDIVADELAQAGFEVLERDARFIDDLHDDHRHRMWLLVSRRPLQDPQPARLPGAPPGPDGLFACSFPRAGMESLADRRSPADSAETRLGSTRVKLCYGRPAARGRAIMGDLVPFGEPWRMGADEATALRVERPVRLGDVRLEPGWYSLYATPEPDAWTVTVNRIADRNGLIIDEWVRAHDVGSFTVPVERTGDHVESLTMRFEPGGAESALLLIEWERTRVRVPVRPGAAG